MKENRLFSIFLAANILAASLSFVSTSHALDYELDDDFSAYEEECWLEGGVYGNWIDVFNGYGTQCIITDPDGYPQLEQTPLAATSLDETHAALSVSNQIFYGDIITYVEFGTQEQLRTGDEPNDWEVGWFLWNYTDNYHFYYIILKPIGWELGKEDPEYEGAQRFLAASDKCLDGTVCIFPIGRWNKLRVTQIDNTITAKVLYYGEWKTLTIYTDTERPYTSGKVGLYTEDARVWWGWVRATTNF